MAQVFFKLATKKFLGICAACLAALLILAAGQYIPEVSARQAGESNLFKELKIFTDVLAIVQRDYVKEVDNRQLVEGAIKGMLATLDPHSGYLDPDFYSDLQVQTKGEFGGLGIEITIRDGLLIVVAPMEGSPAERAGIRAGDAIVKIEGKFTKEFSLVDAVKRLRGPKGTPINISIYRKGQPGIMDVTLIRDNITVKSVRSRYLGDGFAYVRINQFMERTAEDLKNALKKMAKQDAKGELKGLILDLRNNPGGLLTQAIMVSDMFLKEGIIVYTDGRMENQKQKFYAHSRGSEADYPVIVLVNGGSASAAEIVAGAFKDHARALILGTQTFGKGSVQTITPLENGGAVTLTTALYYTKNGNAIQVKGVKPDIEVEAAEEETVEERDLQTSIQIREEDLPGAIDPGAKDKRGTGVSKPDGESLRKLNQTPVVRPDPPAGQPETEDLNAWLDRDRQFQRAFDLLKTFNIFQAQQKVE